MEFAAIIALLEQYRYVVLFPIAAYEGPLVSIITASLIPAGYFNVFLLYPLLIVADVVPDIAYYALGRFGKRTNIAERWGPKAGITAERLDMLKTLWHTHSVKAMMVTKWSYGLSTPMLVIAGLVHLPFRKFVVLSALLSALQYGVLIALGYFFGSYFMQINSALTRIQLIVAAVAIVGVASYVFRRSVTKRLEHVEEEIERDIAR